MMLHILEWKAQPQRQRFNLSERENKVLSNVSSLFGIVTAAKAAGVKTHQKPTAALRKSRNKTDRAETCMRLQVKSEIPRYKRSS
jgi:hypothetical protein